MNEPTTPKKPAFFLDRDGVLATEKSYITSIEDLVIFPFTKECITRIHEAGYLAIMITNQSAVARGMMTEERLIEINQYLMDQTGIDAAYYCPHFLDSSLPPSKYNVVCNCRKPETGMVERALAEQPVTAEGSYFVGDREKDIVTGKKMRMKTIFVKTGHSYDECKVEPDYLFDNLKEAVDVLL